MKQLSICISPLDWGLGHATRCIPLIQSLQSLGHAIYIAAEGHHAVILKEAFPAVPILPLRGYRVSYSHYRSLFFITVLLQGPKILYSAFHEYFWLKKMNKKYHFDLIISDNRVGFFHKQVPSVFITHQLELIMPYQWATCLFQRLQYIWLKNFSACWVPDMEGKDNLSGKLGNPSLKPSLPLWYMGCLARLQPLTQDKLTGVQQKHVLFLGIVSGPEPQRTLLENILWNEGNQLHKKFMVVAGLPLNKAHQRQSETGTLYHHLAGTELATAIQNADYIICRGGYTSLMELIPFKKKLIFVPTPGQTEQEYLGAYWQKNQWALHYEQAHFNVSTALQEASRFEYKQPPFQSLSADALKAALKQLNL